MNKELKVLSIGNSFSQDAQRYLHQIAKADGTKLKAVNLYIGGCPLHKHFININNDSRAYSLEFNGRSTGFFVSVKEALQSDMWDFVTLQQVSHLSTDYSSYQPYLIELAEYINYHSPKSEIIIHQTWAYEEGSDKLRTLMGYNTSADMFADVKSAYEKAAGDIGGARIIPAGETMLSLSEAVDAKVHRDTYHADLGFGRYAIGLTWYEMLTGMNCKNVEFSEFDVEVSPEIARIAAETAHKVVSSYMR